MPVYGRPAKTMKFRVKICGITNAEDARAAIAAGADAIGVNLWLHSKRFVPLPDVAWLAELKNAVIRIAVLVDPSLDEASRIGGSPLFDAVQLHGEETPEFCAALLAEGIAVIKAVRVRNAASLEEARRFPATVPLLLDSFRVGLRGGTGESFDWELARAFREENPARVIILSGGLSAANVTAACGIVLPGGVDVASGVESAKNPRRKDWSMMRAFVAAARAGGM